MRNIHLRVPFAVVVMVLLLALAPMGVFAQTGAPLPETHPEANYDPFVAYAIIGPAPLLPMEFNGTGVFRFAAGTNGQTPLPYPNPNNPNDVMTVVVSLANGVPNVNNPNDPLDALNALGGPGKDLWSWQYNVTFKTFTGTQRQTIPGYTYPEVTIQYRVARNTFITNAFNGANVNIQPPGYTNPQPLDNDAASSYTYVQALDYGDAPNSYGAAKHEIDLATRNINSGLLTKFFYLGAHIDAETSQQFSNDAKGDDNNTANGLNGVAADDEDGVTFPNLLTPGQQATIAVQWTYGSGSATTTTQRAWAYLTAWIDWNGDGVFDDSDGSNEVISHVWDPDEGEWTPQYRSRTDGTKNVTVTVPNDAVTDRPIFARFRLASAEKLTPDEPWTDGEVEDYQINVQPLSVLLADFSAQAQSDHVQVAWETVSEADNAGFNLYRSLTADGEYTLLGYIPSASPGSPSGAAYSYQDFDVQTGQTYWYKLEDINLAGVATMHGPLSVVFGQTPTAVTLGSLGANNPQTDLMTFGLLAGLLVMVAFVLYRRRHGMTA